MTGACYIGLKSNMLKWSYWFGPKPYLFEVSPLESIDVDTQQDFELAQKLYTLTNEHCKGESCFQNNVKTLSPRIN